MSSGTREPHPGSVNNGKPTRHPQPVIDRSNI
jgi:hypothetical protein